MIENVPHTASIEAVSNTEIAATTFEKADEEIAQKALFGIVVTEVTAGVDTHYIATEAGSSDPVGRGDSRPEAVADLMEKVGEVAR